MRQYDWDQALGAEGLLALTEEAVTPPRRGRVPLRRLAALAACVGLVLGLVNYQALAAGVEQVFRYFLGVGVAESDTSLLVQKEPLRFEDGEQLILIDGAFQQDGLLIVPVDIFYRQVPPEEAPPRYRLLVYDAGGEKLERLGIYYDRPTGGKATSRFTDGSIFYTYPLEGASDWLSRTCLAQGYAAGSGERYVLKVPADSEGPYTFAVEAYSDDVSNLGYQPLWEDGVLELDTPQALDTIQASRTFDQGTVTALVGADGRSVAFYGELEPTLEDNGEELVRLDVPTVWFIDEAGNRWESQMLRRGNTLVWWSGASWPEHRLTDEPEGEIVAIEVECVAFYIYRTDRPRPMETQEYWPVYDNLNWVIELPQ